MHSMFALATDFYGLGIMKDHDAFRKPMLWLRFAKACKRCGRVSDGILAIKVISLSSPFPSYTFLTLHLFSCLLSTTYLLTASTFLRSVQCPAAADTGFLGVGTHLLSGPGGHWLVGNTAEGAFAN